MAEPAAAAAVNAATTAAVAAKLPAEVTLAGQAMLWFGVVIVGVLILIFVRAQWNKRNRIDLTDLLLDQSVGKVTQGRFWSLIGGAAGTFVFIYLPVSGHFDPTYASAYLLAVFGLKVAGDITGKPAPGASSEVTTTTSTVRAGQPAPAEHPVLPDPVHVQLVKPKPKPKRKGRK